MSVPLGCPALSCKGTQAPINWRVHSRSPWCECWELMCYVRTKGETVLHSCIPVLALTHTPTLSLTLLANAFLRWGMQPPAPLTGQLLLLTNGHVDLVLSLTTHQPDSPQTTRVAVFCFLVAPSPWVPSPGLCLAGVEFVVFLSHLGCP